MFRDKKGMTIGDIYPVVLTIAIVAILIAVILTIFAGWQEITNTKTATVINESITPTDAGTAVSKAGECGFNSFSVIQALNDSTGTVISSGNYSIDADAGTITNLTSEFTDSAWNVTYSYKYGGEDCEALENITSDFSDFVPWIGIILLIIAAAIVLGIVINSFRGKRV